MFYQHAPARIIPARSPMPFGEIVETAAANLRETGRRYAGSCPRLHVHAWPSFGELPGDVYVTTEGEPIPADPYGDHRSALPVYIRPGPGFPSDWRAIAFRDMAAALRDPLRTVAILCPADPL